MDNIMSRLSIKDYERSCTAHHIDSLLDVLKPLRNKLSSPGRLLDIGCGFGGIALTLKSFLELTEAYGVDIDENAVKEASERGVIACKLDASKETLPYPDNFFDLVTCFGVLDYFPTFDFTILEACRVLKSRGYICVTLPNLASWHNRIALLAGYQPRDIEISSKYLVGVHPSYLRRGDRPVGHIHTITTKGFVQLMELYGFRMVSLRGASPISRNDIPFYLQVIDKMLSKSPFFARRFIYLGVK
ncbi:MAG: class I SAM-dependent methyltransferase [Candidatus Bathyarchaeia archaeon]